MFYQYEIRNNCLYLYITMKYEFSNELSFNDDYDLGRRCKNFIQTNNINFKGNKVYLVVDGIIVKSLDISNVPNNIINSNIYSSDNFLVNIKLDDGSLCEITLREYLINILMYVHTYMFEKDVLKCICILYNTYVYKEMKDNNYIDINNTFIKYYPNNYYKELYDDYSDIMKKYSNIIDEVDCMYLSYNNNYILPFIHYSNCGKTLSNSKYPYLSSVKSLWDMVSPYYVEFNDYKYEDINKILGISISGNSNIFIDNEHIQLDDNIYTLEEFKYSFNLKSTDIYIIMYNTYIKIITRGYGNNYGLSLFGANEMAKNGSKYYNILKYYFPKTKLLKYIKELS